MITSDWNSRIREDEPGRAEAFKARVDYATFCFLLDDIDSRAFDTCFEMWDGDAVVTALVRRAAFHPPLHCAIAKHWWGGEFPQSWRDTAAKYAHVPDERLPRLAAEFRDRARAEYDENFNRIGPAQGDLFTANTCSPGA